MSTDGQKLRIGEAARRLGMTPTLLRAWETRYGVPTPERTQGGLRLYAPAELDRLRAMRDLVATGMAPAEAADAVSGSPGPAGQPTRLAGADDIEALAGELGTRLEAYDDAGSQVVLDELLARFSAEVVVRDVILPALERIGVRWASGQVSVAQEHFGTTVLRGRLLALARGWDRGVGPRAVLACPAGEQHDVGLIAFGLALRAHGWRITYLGQDTPTETLVSTLEALRPAALVLAATMPGSLGRVANDLEPSAGPIRVFVGGRGAGDAGAGMGLPLDPAEAAREVVRAAA